MGRASRRKRVQREAKGNCYDSAVEFMLSLYQSLEQWPQAQERVRLVHATCTGQGPIAGLPIGHAWVEYGDTAYDFSNGTRWVGRAARYRELAQARDVHEYDYRSMLINLNRHEHYGPWHEEEGVYRGT